MTRVRLHDLLGDPHPLGVPGLPAWPLRTLRRPAPPPDHRGGGVVRTADQLRAEAAAVVLHIGRSWSGTDLEDGCPCVKAPCGLVVLSGTAPDCREHGYVDGPKTMRQGHPVERCPAVAGLEPHHRQARFRAEGEAG